jgi:peptidoglycan/LPS O-acetylase OafA/YrhL
VNDRRFIGSLTGLRFVAAATVAIGHGAPSLAQGGLSEFIAQVSSIGMTMFFMLSGFVLWLNYAERFQSQPLGSALREFIVARFARLYPMYAVVVLAIVTYLMITRGLSAPSLSLESGGAFSVRSTGQAVRGGRVSSAQDRARRSEPRIPASNSRATIAPRLRTSSLV